LNVNLDANLTANLAANDGADDKTPTPPPSVPAFQRPAYKKQVFCTRFTTSFTEHDDEGLIELPFAMPFDSDQGVYLQSVELYDALMQHATTRNEASIVDEYYNTVNCLKRVEFCSHSNQRMIYSNFKQSAKFPRRALIFEDADMEMEAAKNIARRRRDYFFQRHQLTRGSIFAFDILHTRTFQNQVCKYRYGKFADVMCDKLDCRDYGPCHLFACTCDVHNMDK